jgi:hypothetical protein
MLRTRKHALIETVVVIGCIVLSPELVKRVSTGDAMAVTHRNGSRLISHITDVWSEIPVI